MYADKASMLDLDLIKSTAVLSLPLQDFFEIVCRCFINQLFCKGYPFL